MRQDVRHTNHLFQFCKVLRFLAHTQAMEHLCETYPNESILFLKRAICTTIVTGLILTVPILYCIIITWDSLNESSLRWWSLIRIILFFGLAFLRWDVYHKLDGLQNDEEREFMLSNVLRSSSWKCTQIGSFIVSMWVCITIISTIILKNVHYYGHDHHRHHQHQHTHKNYFCFEGYLSPCLLRLCYYSIFIFLSHILFIIYWLRSVILLKQNEQKKCSYYSCVNSKKAISKTECTICRNTKGDGQGNNSMIELNQCHHKFHKKCIDEWFKEKVQCPLCMQCCEIQNEQTVNIQNVQNEMILRHRKCVKHKISALSPTSEAIDVLLQSPISADCGNTNNSLFYFMPNWRLIYF